MLIRITAPHFVAGLDTDTYAAAPIIAYMCLWNTTKIKDYCRRKGWKYEIIHRGRLPENKERT